MIKLVSRLRFLFLFILLLAFVLSKAIGVKYKLWEFTDSFLLLLMLLSILIIGNKKKGIMYWLLLPVMTEASLFLLGQWFSMPVVEVFKFGMAAIYMIVMTVACLTFTLADRKISVTTLFGSLSAYLFIGLAYAYIYLVYIALVPDCIQGVASGQENLIIYYSFVTLTTLGFGDLIPTEAIAQMITWLEAFTGQTYLAIIMAQLVGRYVAEHMRPNR